MEIPETKLAKLFHDWSGQWPDSMDRIWSSGGSERIYFRLRSGKAHAVGAWNPVREENRAFLAFSRHFRQHGLHVPDIYAEDLTSDVYLIEDLGDTSLLSIVEKTREEANFTGLIRDYYRQALSELVRFQVEAGRDIDFRLSYPRSDFDQRSITWDLNYFKYNFLKLHIPFHEEKLENDFEQLVSFLGQAESKWFMYRDFQARNMLIRDDRVYFIDYQGGRRGPLQYDVASLLFQVKADLPFPFREEMLEYYLVELNRHTSIDVNKFRQHYDGFTLLRILQVLGAYGFRGLIEKKSHFIQSIPGALKNLEWWLSAGQIPMELPELRKCLASLVTLEKFRNPAGHENKGKLTVAISSFSFMQGLPEDLSGNGGGFVFDCRALPNPGREERYRDFNGRDQVIIEYFEKSPEVRQFLDETENLVSLSVDNYLERGFGRLAVNFGCTGGQHRSVYCAEKMAAALKEKYPQVIIDLDHTMLKKN